MKKKGFTLIELLAVIVILSIIAVIATPIIVGIVENTKKEAFMRSVEFLINATDIDINGKSFEEKYAYILTNGNISDNVPINNIDDMSGVIEYDMSGKANYAIHNGKYCVTKTSDMLKPEIEEYDGNCIIPYDLIAPTLSVESEIVELEQNVTITVNDEGGSGLSEENVYKYYISTSETELLNGNWTDYTSGEAIQIPVSGTYYLWVYPIKDNSDNVNDGKTFGKEYIAYASNKYILTINLDGGSGDLKNNYVLSQNETLEIETPTKEGYTFVNWNLSGTDSSMDNTTFTMGSENATITANWEAIEYTISYDLNGAGSSYSTNYSIESNTFSLVNPTRDGYTFKGWTGSNGETPELNVVIEKGSIGDKEYTANWEVINYTITYNLNGGTNEKNAAKSFTVETETFNLPNPTKEGYTFRGWYTSSNFSGAIETKIEKGTKENKTYYAKWSENIYTIKYDCNGGTGSTESSSHRYGVSEKLSSNGCYRVSAESKMAYGFLGWSTKKTATTATYSDMENVLNLAETGEITLYAVWKQLFTYSGNYTVSDDGNGNWRIKFLSNGTFTPNTNMTIDVFLVGGGAGGRDSMPNYSEPGGGGGYTTTATFKEITAGTPYEIVIGTGGGVNANGNQTTAFNEKANGGKVGAAGETHRGGEDYDLQAGGAGGSGGGGGSARGHGLLGGANGANGGIDGGSGSSGLYEYLNDTDVTYNWFGGSGGAGQGTTTREFQTPVTKVYIVGSTALASNWLSLTSGGSALTPKEGYIYSVMTSGNYYYHDYIWNGSKYVETDLARVYGSGGGAGAARNGSGGKGYWGAANGTSASGTKGSATPNTGGGGGGASLSNVTGSAGASGIVVIRNSLPPLDLEYTYTGESKVINDGNGDWRIKFLTSGTLTLTKDMEIDLFLVGGGGRGGAYAGGGGGYTKTVLGIKATAGTPYEIVVGDGGDANNDGNGESSTAFTYEAKGGNTTDGHYSGNGGSGGSGGGGYGGCENGACYDGGADTYYGGDGGYDGRNGGGAGAGSGGSGQGTTTREFGEAHGDLYAGGGGGSWTGAGGAGGGGNGANNPVSPGTAGVENTGGGGGNAGLDGGSGIVIIRNKR